MKHNGIVAGLVSLLTAFSLVSCIEKNNTLGSALVPSNQDIPIARVTLDLPVTLRIADSLQTSIASNGTVGAISSETFGLYHSDAAMSITAAYDSIDWGRNPSVRNLYVDFTLDSAMVLRESQRYIPQNLYVHQLKVELDSTTVYNNSLGPGSYDPEVISEGGSIYTGGETFTVNLKKEFGERLFKIPMATLDSAELFMKNFYGLYLRCDDPEPGTEGGRLNSFDLSASYIYLTYDYDDEEGHRRTNTAAFSLGAYYTVNVSTPGSRSLERSDPREALYMEGLCGIKPHISARQLRTVIDQWLSANGLSSENLLVAKATLHFPFTYDGDLETYGRYAVSIFPSKRVKGKPSTIYNPIAEINNSSLEGGSIDRSKLEYASNVSLYLQDLIRRDPSEITEADDLWMMGTVSYSDSYSGSTTFYSDYFYYTQTWLNGTADLRHPVLELTYSVLQ